eukprot:CAMPEP_0174361264 /NCGR_PEP_ID=MMETSP0811_2-20130205/58396_1 /TAXON_ID=73025 ORGANISM="Eutreptiella gymnastica-like, Strain CCMP1594" /NCGR_SAMPLE_ID=MMETSP0811_2 /ASSEMBLY_ACC=CAM_ASM_000667 /LENGTH=188 /DNA_ID=CAMNT_0015497765 /DNA_START=622 /DNA_END=1189 /DNA_ORIENTATION=-
MQHHAHLVTHKSERKAQLVTISARLIGAPNISKTVRYDSLLNSTAPMPGAKWILGHHAALKAVVRAQTPQGQQGQVWDRAGNTVGRVVDKTVDRSRVKRLAWLDTLCTRGTAADDFGGTLLAVAHVETDPKIGQAYWPGLQVGPKLWVDVGGANPSPDCHATRANLGGLWHAAFNTEEESAAFWPAAG